MIILVSSDIFAVFKENKSYIKKSLLRHMLGTNLSLLRHCFEFTSSLLKFKLIDNKHTAASSTEFCHEHIDIL